MPSVAEQFIILVLLIFNSEALNVNSENDAESKKSGPASECKLASITDTIQLQTGVKIGVQYEKEFKRYKHKFEEMRPKGQSPTNVKKTHKIKAYEKIRTKVLDNQRIKLENKIQTTARDQRPVLLLWPKLQTENRKAPNSNSISEARESFLVTRAGKFSKTKTSLGQTFKKLSPCCLRRQKTGPSVQEEPPPNRLEEKDSQPIASKPDSLSHVPQSRSPKQGDKTGTGTGNRKRDREDTPTAVGKKTGKKSPTFEESQPRLPKQGDRTGTWSGNRNKEREDNQEDTPTTVGKKTGKKSPSFEQGKTPSMPQPPSPKQEKTPSTPLRITDWRPSSLKSDSQTPLSPERQKYEAFSLPDNIKSIVMIPGLGEFVYDTRIQQKKAQTQNQLNEYIPFGPPMSINQNSNFRRSDAMLSLDQLQEDLPNVEWISVVVYWFASDKNIHDCKVYPAVEYWHAYIESDEWKVAGISRLNARLVARDADGKAKNGGTVSDAALIRYIEELHRRGYKVMLYPKLLLRSTNKKWRGELTGSVWSVYTFFNRQYNYWIYHYANIAQKTNVEAFIIGSEMVQLTGIKDIAGNYPVVSELVNLAQKVKSLLGSEVIVTYAAHWSEYNSYGGPYYMDKLWASNFIDVVGINAYFPLTDEPEPSSGYAVKDVIDGWTKGVGYDYFVDYTKYRPERIRYTDSRWAWKNIEHWWSEAHTQPNGQQSEWRPKMKKIWFTEYGFANVNGCTNEPEVFVAGSLEERKYPRHSNKEPSFHCQKVGIEGTLRKWQDSEMVENMFLWAWDARPYPQFPNLVEVWQDCGDYETGHWIQGKIGKIGSRRDSMVSPRPAAPPPSPTQSFDPERGAFLIIVTLRDNCPPTIRRFGRPFRRSSIPFDRPRWFELMQS